MIIKYLYRLASGCQIINFSEKLFFAGLSAYKYATFYLESPFKEPFWFFTFEPLHCSDLIQILKSWLLPASELKSTKYKKSSR